MRRLYIFAYLLLCLFIVSCESSTPPPTPSMTPEMDSITPENIHQLVQLDYHKEDGSGADITLPKDNQVTSVAFSPNGEILAAGYGINVSDASVYLYDLASGKQIGELETNLCLIYRVAFSPNGKLIAAGGGCDHVRRGIQIWDVETQAQLLKLEDPGDMIFDIAFSPDGAVLALAEGGSWFGPGLLKMWSVTSGELLSKFPSAKPPWIYTWGVSFNPDGTLLAFNHESCTTVDLWDVANQKEYKVLPNSKCDKCLGVAFSHDGKLVASCGVYDIAAGELLFELEGAESAHFSIVSNVAFSPNGQLIGSAGSDRILLWDVSNGIVLAELLGSNDIAFSRDGHLVATGGDVVRVWGMPPH